MLELTAPCSGDVQHVCVVGSTAQRVLLALLHFGVSHANVHAGAIILAASVATAVSDPVTATQGLISRLLGAQYISLFSLEVIAPDPATGHNVFELATGTDGVSVVIRGNNGVWFGRVGLQHSLPRFIAY